MIDGARELNPLGHAAAVIPPRTVTAPVQPIIPVVLRATAVEAVGARMRVGGMRIIDRAIRQLVRLRDARIIVATDGSIALPRRLPENVERREIQGDVQASLAALHRELGDETTTVGADTVWLQPARFDRGIRVVDGASRRAASASVFDDLQRDAGGIL